MAKIEITCSDTFKDMVKELADKNNLSVASYIKMILSKEIKND